MTNILFNRFFYICVALIFVALSVLAHNVPYFPFDLLVTRTLQTNSDPLFHSIMHWISWIGFFPAIMLIAIAILIALYGAGYRREAKFELISIMFMYVVGNVVKILVNQPRALPSLIKVEDINLDHGHFSYPAGHVMFYVSIFGFLFYLLYLHKDLFGKLHKIILIVCGFLIAVIGYSRIYLGDHWLSDVIAGYMLGYLTLIPTIYLYAKRKAH